MTSLFTALSGLQAHQGWMDVIGNNLANSSTPGFKTSRATFSDNFSQTLRNASAPSAALGGRNPMQIGHGVRLADVGHDFAQGVLNGTGRTFDLALEGRGFFALEAAGTRLYSRVGAFGLDAARNLIDVRSGYRVVGSDGQAVQLDMDSLFPPQATSSLSVQGNLPAEIGGPLREVLESNTPLRHGDPATLTGSASEPFPVPIGETWTMSLRVDNGAPQTVSLTSTTGSFTAAEVATAIDALDGVSASAVGGQVQIVTDRKGQSANVKVDPGAVGADLASLLGLSTALTSGTESALTPTTTLNDLPGNRVPYQPGDSIQISGVDNDGSPISATFQYGAAFDGETVDAFVAFLDGLYSDATVSLDSDGRIVLEADTAGESGLTLAILDDSAAAGDTQWSTYALSVSEQGTGPDVVTSSIEVFDPAGLAHTVTFTFERQEDLTWTIIPSMDPAEGQVQSAPITGLTFAEDGTPLGLNNLALDVVVTFGSNSPQTVTLDLGQDGGFDGITQFGGEGSAFVREQDGYGVGELSNVEVEGDGTVRGLYTNGQSRSLAQIGVATFSNPDGLRHVGDNFWAQTTNSGALVFGAGQDGSAGSVVGGSLEGSNVDVAEQFVRLIEAQRGFQANARVIGVQDDMLQETVNLV